MKGDSPMPRRYQKMQELLPKMKDMLEGGMSRREVAEKLVLIGAEELLVVSCSTGPKRSLVLRVKTLRSQRRPFAKVYSSDSGT